MFGDIRRSFGICLALAILVLPGCTSVPGAPPAAEKSSIKSIGIVSGVGDELFVRKVGITIFGNKVTAFKPSWDVDAFMAAEIVKRLDSRLSVVPVKVNSSALYLPANSSLALGESGLPTGLNDLPSNADVDAFLIVNKLAATDPIFGTSAPVFGLGVYKRPLLEAPFALYRISLVDARSKTLIAAQDARIKDDSFLGDNGFPKIMRQKNIYYAVTYKYPETAEEFTDAQKSDLEAELKDLIERSLTYTLKKMELSR